MWAISIFPNLSNSSLLLYGLCVTSLVFFFGSLCVGVSIVRSAKSQASKITEQAQESSANGQSESSRPTTLSPHTIPLPTETRISILIVVVLLGVIVYKLFSTTSTTYVYDDLRVVRVITPLKYVFCCDANHHEFEKPICDDYAAPDFEEGITLTKAIFVDEGKCWSLNPNKHAGYYKKRGLDGEPIITTQ